MRAASHIVGTTTSLISSTRPILHRSGSYWASSSTIAPNWEIFSALVHRQAAAGRGKLSDSMEAIRNTVAENFGGEAQSVATHQFSLDQVPDLTGKIAVVTGGSEGIGYGCTHTLLKHNIAKVYILSLSEEVVKGAKGAVGKELGQEAANRTKWMFCDLSDWERVKEVAEEIRNDADRLDILLNNAARGIMTYQLTDFGVDRHMAVNHMGHVILTSYLLPLMKQTAQNGDIVRIVNQSSNAHQAAPNNTRFESLEELNHDLGPNGQYGRSKLAGILYARYFTRKVTKAGYSRVLMNATHPGIVSTKMSREDIFEPFPLGGYAMAVGMEPFKKDQFQGAVSTMFAGTYTQESGQYICPPAVPETGSKLSQDDELADNLMDLTWKVMMEKTRDGLATNRYSLDDLVVY
ncbi:NAD(P)-binding protein [Hypomontagnella monticulosa]|nr:NAD(P)-binding protein [Hypomontagnella monticulosa]